MRTIKIRNILTEDDLSNNYVVLFNKDDEFCGFIEKIDEREFRFIQSSDEYEMFSSLEELLEDFCVFIIKVVSIEEIVSIMQPLLNAHKHENS